ncbi:hypothetical protein DFH29DRAFT_875849 [Suillus ampliporus]|nr:hypothetical protein DFH29DRAFT_875849 [Suillus ampliporus]
MLGWPDGEQQLGSQTRGHSNPLYIDNPMNPLFGFDLAERDETFDQSESFMLQPSQPGLDHLSHDVTAGSLDGGHHGPDTLAHPKPCYAIPSAFYTAWLSPQPRHLSYMPATHAESSSMHQLQSQAYPEPSSSHQPMIGPPTLDLEFDNSASSGQSPTAVAKLTGVRPVLKNAKRVGMERAQFSRKVEAGASSATAQGSSGMSSDVKIVPGSGIRKLLEGLRDGMRTAMFRMSILPAIGSLSNIVDATWKDVANNQFSGTDRTWAQEMLNDKKYVDEKMGTVFDEVSQEMTEAARFFTYHYCGIDFDDMAIVVDKLAINQHAKRIRGQMTDDVFLYGQLSVSPAVRPRYLADSMSREVDRVNLSTIAFTSETIIRMTRYLLCDGPHQYHKYISQGNFGPLLIMTATVCRWALQEHGTGFYVKSQFLPDENTQCYAHYHAIFEGLDPKVVAALVIQITSNSALTG